MVSYTTIFNYNDLGELCEMDEREKTGEKQIGTVGKREKRRGWAKSKVSPWHEDSMQIIPNIWPHANPLSPLKQIELITQIPLPSSSVAKICLSLIHKPSSCLYISSEFLVVAQLNLFSSIVLMAGIYVYTAIVSGLGSVWFCLQICVKPVAGRRGFHANHKAAFSGQLSGSRGKANRFRLRQMLLADLHLWKKWEVEV